MAPCRHPARGAGARAARAAAARTSSSGPSPAGPVSARRSLARPAKATTARPSPIGTHAHVGIEAVEQVEHARRQGGPAAASRDRPAQRVPSRSDAGPQGRRWRRRTRSRRRGRARAPPAPRGRAAPPAGSRARRSAPDRSRRRAPRASRWPRAWPARPGAACARRPAPPGHPARRAGRARSEDGRSRARGTPKRTPRPAAVAGRPARDLTSQSSDLRLTGRRQRREGRREGSQVPRVRRASTSCAWRTCRSRRRPRRGQGQGRRLRAEPPRRRPARGHLALPARAAAHLGLELAGEIVEVGPGVSDRWKVGDRVAPYLMGPDPLDRVLAAPAARTSRPSGFIGFTMPGGFAEYACVPGAPPRAHAGRHERRRRRGLPDRRLDRVPHALHARRAAGRRDASWSTRRLGRRLGGRAARPPRRRLRDRQRVVATRSSSPRARARHARGHQPRDPRRRRGGPAPDRTAAASTSSSSTSAASCSRPASTRW